MHGQKAAAEWLLQQGLLINAADYTGHTALYRACGNGESDDAPMIELLLANGADVHRRTDDGYTALDGAAISGKAKCAKVLIAAGADVIRTDSRGCSALHSAIMKQNGAVVQLLLEHGATAVMNAVTVGCFNGAHCCAELTALMMCSTVDTLKVLLAAGADVHVTTQKGNTCLHVAAKHKWSAPMVCLLVLIKAGADLYAVNSAGKTAAQLAHDRGHTLIEQLLSRAAQQRH
jgi:ankyrin repeat protein